LNDKDYVLLSPYFVIGLGYFVAASYWNLGLSEFGHINLLLSYMVLEIVLILGVLVVRKHSIRQYDGNILVQAFYTLSVLFLILVNIIMIFSPIFIDKGGEWRIFFEYVAGLVGFPSVILISLILPRIDKETIPKKVKTKKKIVIKILLSCILAITYSSIFILWFFLYQKPFGLDRGVSSWLLYAIFSLSIVSFNAVCSIFLLQKKGLYFRKPKLSATKNKELSILTLTSIIGFFTTLGPCIKVYQIQDINHKYVTFNFIFYCISIVTSFIMLILIYFLKTNFIERKESKQLLSS